MKLISVTCVNFRCFEDETFLFQNQTVIRARNTFGKSSIAEAVVWCLFGTDMGGKTKADTRLMRRGAKSMSVETTWTTDAGESLKILRDKPDSGPVKLLVNGRKAKAGEVEGLFGAMGEFLSVFLPGYFNGLEPKDARSVLANCVPELSTEDVLNQLSEMERELLKNTKFGMGVDSAELLTKKYRDEIRERQEETSRLDGEARAYQDIIKQGPPQMPQDSVTPEERQQYEQAKVRLATSPMAAEERKRQRDLLVQQRDTMRKTFKTLRDSLVDVNKLACPTCGQKLPEENAKTIMANKNAPIEERLQELTSEGSQLNDEISRLEYLQVSDVEDLSQLQQIIDDVDAKMQTDTDARATYAAQLKLYERAQQSIQEIEKDRAGEENMLFNLQEQVKALNAFKAAYVRLQHDKLNSHFKHVTIQLMTHNKETGETRADFTVMWKKKPYKTLSHSEKIRCDIEIGRVISAPRLEAMPVFVDDAESVQDLWSEQFSGQVIAAYVWFDSALVVEERNEAVETLLEQAKNMISLVHGPAA